METHDGEPARNPTPGPDNDNRPQEHAMKARVFVACAALVAACAIPAIGTEDERMKSHHGPKLPNGGAVQWAFITFDGTKDISASKLWAKIQRPTIADPQFKDVRDITSIQLVRKK